MVSATDVITYIGVPLAVLGVSPIFYTFTLALYTRLKLQPVLRKNGIDPRIRARLMTGVVEVDLPVLQLYPLHRQEQQYWLRSVSPKTVDGASWSYLNFESTEIDLSTSRLQRSDKVTLPEARIFFKDLLYYLQDLGCYPDLDGFHKLRSRGQNTAGVSLMLHEDTGDRTILEVAKSGDRHGLISLRFVNHGWLWSPSHIRDSTTVLPPFFISGPLLESQHDDASLETDIVAHTANTPDGRIKPSGTSAPTETRRYFVIRPPGELKMEISILETPAPSKRNKLSSEHLDLLSSDHSPEDGQTPSGFWRHWFACAAVTVYGFEKRQPFYRFLPNQRFLHKAQLYDIEVESALYYGLVDGCEKAFDERLEYVNDSDFDFVNANHGPGAPQPIQLADGRHRKWATKKDLVTLVSSKKKRVSLSPTLDELEPIFEKQIAMPNLTRLCLHWLTSNPINFESLSIGSFPKEPWNLEKITQHTADLVVRTAILDVDFAKKLKLQVGRLMGGLAHEATTSRSRHAKIHSKLWKRSSQEESGHFCCAIVLLAIIGQRASYLLSGQDVKHFEEEWPQVYLS